jgi:sporulation protein YlmC with PRC-barrel domain
MSYTERDPYGMYRYTTGEKQGPGPELMGANTLQGEDVYNAKGEDLGDVKEIMIDMRSGRIAYAVLSFGGVLGMGTKLFAVPWSALKLDTVNKRFTLDINKGQLEGAPGFDKDAWPRMSDRTCATQVHSYYKVKPYWD